MSRIIGCEQLYIAKVTKDDTTGTTWGTPKRVPSLISIDVTDQTDTVTFYADNQIEQVIPSFAGKEVEIVLGYLNNELEANSNAVNTTVNTKQPQQIEQQTVLTPDQKRVAAAMGMSEAEYAQWM